MHVALIGTRGVPAHYGGFETAIEEIGRRLADRGHEVVVYCRGGDDPSMQEYLGMQLVHLPAARKRALETLSHTGLSTVHLMRQRRRPDAAVVFNAANAPFVPFLRMRGVPVAVHVDGLEWRRAKWSGVGQRYYRVVESLSVRWADALIADAAGIADYYRDEFGAQTELLAYGAPIQTDPGSSRVDELGLQPRKYHLVVARFEPENHVAEIVAGYVASHAALPLVVVGSAPYADEYTEHVRALAGDDSRVRLLGGLWDQQQLDELYANALTYLHGHSVGGTNPSLLRAMGAGSGVLAYDVVFNREVLGESGRFFASPDDLAGLLDDAEADPSAAVERGVALRQRAAEHYRWDDVALGYERLLERLAAGESVRQQNKRGWRRQPARAGNSGSSA
jgi:glycosyltransferase involved in cell wall biosynthesis